MKQTSGMQVGSVDVFFFLVPIFFFYFKVEEEGTRKGTGSPWMDSSLFFSAFLLIAKEKEREEPSMNAEPSSEMSHQT